MMTCTGCGYRFLVVSLKCSQDPLSAPYCAQCFPTTGCEDQHAEGCAVATVHPPRQLAKTRGNLEMDRPVKRGRVL